MNNAFSNLENIALNKHL